MFPFLCFCALVAALSVSDQQTALDSVAEYLVSLGQTGCTAPNLTECEGTCTGTRCGTFSVKVDEEKNVVGLALDSNKMTKIPTAIGKLTCLTSVEGKMQ